jgi:hypothetical protein
MTGAELRTCPDRGGPRDSSVVEGDEKLDSDNAEN